MHIMNRIIKLLALFLGLVFLLNAKAEPIVLTYHDVQQKNIAGDYFSVTAEDLATQIQWLKLSGWTILSLSEFQQIKRGTQKAPDKSVLIMFDDAEKSTCTIVHPLLSVQKVPFTVAVVSSWIENPEYKDKYCSWSELKNMAADPLVSFATHSHNLHRDVISNKWGNRQPAAVTQEWTSNKGVESLEEYQDRVSEDLKTSKTLIFKGIGKYPEAVVWPYGWFNSATIRAAKLNGFDTTFTLNNGSLDLDSYKRRLITKGTTLAQFKYIMNSRDFLETSSRSLWLAMSLTEIPEDTTEGALSGIIDRLSRLDISKLIISDYLSNNYSSRVAWQIKARLGITPYLNLATGSENFENSNLLAEGAFVEECNKKSSTSFTDYYQNNTVYCYPSEKSKKIKDLRFIAGCENLGLLAEELSKHRQSGVSDFILPSSIAVCPVLPDLLKKEISK